MSTRDRILSLLRRQALTVTELTVRLGVSRNAVIVPLRALEASGLIAGTRRRAAGAGKPALEYTAVAGREDIASGAYPAFTEVMLAALPRHMTRAQVEGFMDDVGRGLAAGLGRDESAGFPARLRAATDFVDSVGAETVVERTAGGAVVRSYSCPLARAVRREPCVCAGVARFFATVTGGEVRERCTRGEHLRCEFEITEKAPG